MADQILAPRIDFSRVSSLVLGKYWSRATPEQRESFSREFKRLLVRTYATTFLDFEDWEIRFLPMPPGAGDHDATVRTQVVQAASPPVTVLYRLRRDEDGWKAYDVVIEGVSLVKNYRVQFNDILSKSSYAELLERLKSKVREGS